MLKKQLFLLVIAPLFISGCAAFHGQYTTPGTVSDNENTADFKEGEKMLEGRLDDISSGMAKPGEPSAKTAVGQSAVGAVNSKPNMVIDKTKKYYAVLKTEAGDITILFTADKTPITVNNFITLAGKKFYNNTVFHRTIKGFMIQGGDPLGNGTGGPGYEFEDEPFEGEYARGTVAMANHGANTNGSQFFIMHKDYPLQKDYVIFGHVIQGIEVVDKIAEAPVSPSSGGEGSTPMKPVKILSVEIYQE